MRMTKADAFGRAVGLIFKNNDFSLFNEIYHPDYSAPDIKPLVSWRIKKMKS